MRKLISLVIVAALVLGGIYFGPKLVHRCGNCENVFVGTGYYPNVVSDILSALNDEEDKILCADCAAQEHALGLAAGKSLTEFKRPLFEKKNED